MQKRNPDFIMFVGSMFSSKTTRMLSALDRYTYQHKKVIAFKPKMDDRYTESEICTHSGLKFPATNVVTGTEIVEKSLGYNIIGVDEAFMIDGCASALLYLFKQGKTIVVSSLQLSATGRPFDEIKEMFPWATKIEVCSSICAKTQNLGYYTVGKVKNLNEIEIGGKELYEPRCWLATPFMNQNYSEDDD